MVFKMVTEKHFWLAQHPNRVSHTEPHSLSKTGAWSTLWTLVTWKTAPKGA